MTETLTGKQVLALLAQDEPPEIEYLSLNDKNWLPAKEVLDNWGITALRTTGIMFRIKPTPQRRLSVTLANGEVVSWPEPVREALKDEQDFWHVDDDGEVFESTWCVGGAISEARLAFGNVHLTKENAQEHADALRKINTQGGE